MEKNIPKVTRAWCFYDWANSVYSLVIISTIFPIYYGAVTRNADGTDNIIFLGFNINSSVLFSYSISFSYLVIAFLNPLLTAIADYSGRKKLFLQFFCTIGALSCAGLFFFTKETFTTSMFLFMLAAMGWTGSIVFYNSYLPDIATEDQYDKLSARGFALGYIGSVLQLIFNLALVLQPALFGLDPANESLPPRIAFLTTGIWWFAFAQYTFFYLPKYTHTKPHQHNWILNGFNELKKVFNQVQQLGLLKRFLLSFFFYSMGVQTVMNVAAIFGDKELHLESYKLIITILILQLVAILGAYGFAYLSEKIGNIKTLAIAVVIWIGICIGAYFIYSEFPFYALAAAVGLVMGGIQSLSRSTYSKLIPADTKDTASYFSFYDITEKLAIVLGTFAYGAIAQLTGSMRNSVLALMVFFVLGLICLLTIKDQKFKQERVLIS
ncbi:MFS transporter [Adhaeribacter aquaticus]|uniref:MFS transporter n=1 Tax=Adhaeribacter aquaticus TaxID=299567 RepID=UPI0004269364|nr:MFS transporter [Adhaeribacter aquaticus]